METIVNTNKKRIKKPLKRSIQIGCIVFIVILCLTLGLNIFFSYKSFFFKQNQIVLSNIIHYVDRYIDDDDLKQCIKTKIESPKYKEMMLFFDNVKEDFEPQYLYIIKPIKNKDGTYEMFTVASAENSYDRYENTEGNLFLGDMLNNEYTNEEIKDIFEVMDHKDIVYMESNTFWGHSYCGYYALRDSKGVPYAVLGVDTDLTQLSNDIFHRTIAILSFIVLIGIASIGLFLFWATKNVTEPLEKLEESAKRYIEKSKDIDSLDKLTFKQPDLNIDNEIESLSNTINEMTEDIKKYIYQIINTEKESVHMKELASTDSLTGVRNKLAYDEKAKYINKKITEKIYEEFGMVMFDVNNLKHINDTYGHKYGDYLIQNFCAIICDVFAHSPIFRVGGDEFVVILQKKDLENSDNLISEAKSILNKKNIDDVTPWEHPSAAIGVAYFNKNIDKNVENVFSRADADMYQNKKLIKGKIEK